MNLKKVISKNVTEICTFFTFTHVRQTCFACNFFLCIFLKLFQRIRSQREILRFLISFSIFLQKRFLGVILALFANFEAKCAKNGSKNQKTYFVNVSQISKGLYSSFSKKKSNSLYPTRYCVKFQAILFIVVLLLGNIRFRSWNAILLFRTIGFNGFDLFLSKWIQNVILRHIIFATFSTDSRSASNSALFYTHIEGLQLKIQALLALFVNSEVDFGRSGSKNQVVKIVVPYCITIRLVQKKLVILYIYMLTLHHYFFKCSRNPKLFPCGRYSA